MIFYFGFYFNQFFFIKVVVTGSMIPFCEVFTDARRNFLVSVLVAANSDIPEVCIFFNNVLLRGNRTSKISSTW